MSTEDDFLRKLRATFKIEAEEHMQAIAAGLLALEKSPSPNEQQNLVDTVFRAAHSFKGAARAVNFTEVEAICQSIEDVFASWKRQRVTPSPETLDQVLRSLDGIAQTLAAPATPPPSRTAKPGHSAPPARDRANTPAVPSPMRPAAERPAGNDTVRITVAKLEERLLESEELLEAKLTAAQRATDLRELGERFEDWRREWSMIQADLREAHPSSSSSKSGGDNVPTTGMDRFTEFCEWNHEFVRSLESRINTLSHMATQDHLAIGKLVDDLLANSKKLLMLPVATLGALLRKVVRDLCRDQGKEAEFILRGEEVEIDKRILEEMKDPLIHLLRNCVDHGIEPSHQRVHSGKSAQATIRLTVSPVNGSKVELVISDDGSGIDAEDVKASAVRHGVLSRDQANQLSDAEALDLVFRNEVSTSPIITQLSGRGLGLAIVKEKTDNLGGHLSIESHQGVGTTIRITLPVAQATFRGILVESEKRQFIVPTSQVQRVARFTPANLRTVEGRETLELNGRAIALARLGSVLELPSERHDEPHQGVVSTPVIVLGAGDQCIAFAVDAVRDEHEVLVKPLHKPLSRVRNISGATVLGSGRVAPILNVSDLLKSARRAAAIRGSPATIKATPKAISVLIVEDSITSRMLLRGILESAGYQVKTAVDGLDAFTTLRSEHFDIVVSDVEMPRMNGFDLTARIRADKKLAELPVILVTALETREDRERGIDVGASAYLVKRSFDQSNLLEAVQRLT